MRQRAFVLVSVLAGTAGAVVLSAQVTTKFKVEGFAAVAVVDTFYRVDLKSPEGYTIKITPLEKTFTIDNVHASAKYKAEFKAQDDFGCGLVQMYPDKGAIVDGNIICGKNFHGGDALKVTGTMERVR